MIDAIIAALKQTGLYATPSSQADPSRADTVPGLVSLVDPVVERRLWPIHLPSGSPETNGVYVLAGQGEIEADGYRLGRVDTYILSLRSPTFDPLRAMSDALIERVAQHQGAESWEITDAATDYEYEQRQYRAHFELQATSLATSLTQETPVLPAAYVHHVQADAAPNDLQTCRVRQTVTEQVAVVLVDQMGSVESRRQTISAALLGLEFGDDQLSPLEYLGGQRVAVSGRYVYWREVFSYQRVIHS